MQPLEPDPSPPKPYTGSRMTLDLNLPASICSCQYLEKLVLERRKIVIGDVRLPVSVAAFAAEGRFVGVEDGTVEREECSLYID